MRENRDHCCQDEQNSFQPVGGKNWVIVVSALAAPLKRSKEKKKGEKRMRKLEKHFFFF